MQVFSIQYIPGAKYEVLGLVKGNTVRSKNAFQDIGAGFKSLVGGELRAYTDMLAEAREQAQERMIEHAESLGANGVIGVQFTGGEVMQGSAEIVCYGTAVRFLS